MVGASLWEGTSCLVATFWLVLERRGANRWNQHLADPWRWFGKHLAWMPLIAVTFIVAIYGIRHGVYALTNETYEHESWSYIFVYESAKLVLFAGLWLGIIFGLESFARWREEREQLLALQKHLAESQLAQLKAQLQPHFLFNALNTISSLMQVDVERADRLLTRLADLLRASLRRARVTRLRCARNSSCWSSTRRSCRNASRVVSRSPGASRTMRSKRRSPPCCCNRCSKMPSNMAWSAAATW